MRMNKEMYYFVAAVVMALVSYIPRALPITLFTKQIRSRFIRSFLYYVPYAVLGGLTFPGIFYCTDSFWTALVGTLVALIVAFFEKSLVIVAAAAVLSVFLSGLFL